MRDGTDRFLFARFVSPLLIVNISLWPLPAFALKPTETRESAGLKELDKALRTGLEEVLPQPHNLEDRLLRLAGISRVGSTQAVRASLAALAHPEDEGYRPLSREELVKRLVDRVALIATRPLDLTRVRTPWGEIDLTRLNDLGRYRGEHAVAELARDLELAHWLGFLQIQNMRSGLSPQTLYTMLRSHLPIGAEKVSVGWIVWSNLLEDLKVLQTEGTWTSDDKRTTLTYKAEADGSPLFTVNGDAVADPNDAQRAFLLAHPDVVHFGNAFTALPVHLKQTHATDGKFRWPVLEGSREDWIPELAAGLEERRPTSKEAEFGAGREPVSAPEQVSEALILLDEAAQGAGVVVIRAEVVSRRMGLAEFVARVPRELASRIVLFGKDSAEIKDLARRNGILVVDSDSVVDLAGELMGFEKADWIGFVGDPAMAEHLGRILPASMIVEAIDPDAGMREVLLALGIPESVLEQVDTNGLEGQLARLRAA